MRRARGDLLADDVDDEPPRQRRRAAVADPPAAAAPAPAGRVTRQQARAQAAAAAAAAAAAGPRRGARVRAAAEAPAGPEDDQQQQQQQQQKEEEQKAEAAAAGDSEYDEGESNESDKGEGEGSGSEDSNDRDAEVVRRLGLMPPGGESDDECEDEEEDEYEDEDEEECEDEAEYEDEEGYESDGGYGYGPVVLPGGPDWDIVVGGPVGTPARARGVLLQRLPGDVEVTTGVWAREQPDQRHILYGAPLANCPKLLSRIFKFKQQPGQLMWKSDSALNGSEWAYVKGVFAHQRLAPLLQHGRRVLEPLPGWIPTCFKPVDASGQRLTGPKVSRNGKPWNQGRQFFSSFKQGDDSSFIWADGVRAMESEAQDSFRESMGGGMFYGMF